MPVKVKRKKSKSRKDKTLKIVVFACSRTVESNISSDHIHLSLNNKVPVVPIMCSGRINCAILMKAFESGADGVLVAGCNPDECRFGFGARYGVATVIQAQKILNLLGIEKERIKFSGGMEITDAYRRFKNSLKKIGQLK